MNSRKIQLIFLSFWTFLLVLHLTIAKPSQDILRKDNKRDPGGGFYLKECDNYYECDYGQTCDEEFHMCVPNYNEKRNEKRDVFSRRSGYFPISECFSDFECDYGMKCDPEYGFCMDISGGEKR